MAADLIIRPPPPPSAPSPPGLWDESVASTGGADSEGTSGQEGAAVANRREGIGLASFS